MKNSNNQDGTILVVLVIVISVITMLGTSLLAVTMMNYKIKKANSEVRQSFYMSESGLNFAYEDAYMLVKEGIEDSLNKANEYIKNNPEDSQGAEDIFTNNYKLFISGQIGNKINDNGNPTVQVNSMVPLTFNQENCMKVPIKSIYKASNIVKTTYVDIIILVPEYDIAYIDVIEISDLIILKNWLLTN